MQRWRPRWLWRCCEFNVSGFNGAPLLFQTWCFWFYLHALMSEVTLTRCMRGDAPHGLLIEMHVDFTTSVSD